jgi:amino acid transporter, AAT family
MNFVVLTAALSGANAALYVASRMLFSSARKGWAPRILGTLNKAASPKPAVLASSWGIVVALVLERWAPREAFVSILGAALFGLMLSWLVSFAAHVNFRRRLPSAEALAMRSPFGGWGSVAGFGLVSAAILHTWWTSRISMISGVTYLVLLTIIFFAVRKNRQTPD